MTFRGKLFCDINPTCYKISEKKEICKRHIQNLKSKETFSAQQKTEKLPVKLWEHSSHLIKRGKGIDPVLQENKAINIRLACQKLNGMIIKPGEVFSFWKAVGKTSRRKGYKDGRVIVGNKVLPGIGGGLCNLGHTVHILALHSPLKVTEFHSHSDALAPDGKVRIPFATGTSISYNNLDLRFKNETDQNLQLCLWCDEDNLYGELRCEKPVSQIYEIVEEDHHFKKKNDKYYSISKIYKVTKDKGSNQETDRRLILDNKSQVMYDYDMIPKEKIRV